MIQKIPPTLVYLLCLSFFFPKKTQGQKINTQLRYFSEIENLYPRIDIQTPLTKKISICGGLSKDALQMIDLTAKYSIRETIQLEAGFGYHKQNALHFIYGIKSEFETKKLFFEGYFRGYVDHKSLHASEIECLYKISRIWIGCIADIEYGKYMPKWSEVTPREHLVKESLLLGGLTTQYKLSPKISVNIFMLYGQQTIDTEKTRTYKIGLGLKINLRNQEHHPR